jgi:hypothetical protein
MLAGSLIPIPGAGILKGAKLGAQVLGHAALGAGEMGARSLISGDDKLGQDVLLGAAGGAGGTLIGKAVGKGIGAIGEKMAGGKLQSGAERMWLANAMPNLTSKDLRQFSKQTISGGPASMRRADEVVHDLFEPMNKAGLGTKRAQEEFIEKTLEDWEKFDSEAEKTGVRLSNPEFAGTAQKPGVIDALPSVKAYRDHLRRWGRSQDDELLKIISAADGTIPDPAAPNGVSIGPPRPASQVRATLDGEARDAFDAARSSVLKGFGQGKPEEKRLLAAALQDIDNAYFEDIVTKINKPEMTNNMKARYALSKLMALNDSKGATDLGGMRMILGSSTAARLNPDAKGLMKSALGQLLLQGTRALSRPILRGLSGAVATGGIPVIGGNGLANVGGRLGTKITAMTQADTGTEPGSQMPDVNSDLYGGDPNAPGGGQPPPGGGQPQGGQPQGNIPAQEIQYTPGQAKGSQDPGQFITPQARSAAIKYGYKPTPMDDKILQGIEKLFIREYSGTLSPAPEVQKQFHDRFAASILQELHTGPGGTLDTQKAARILFPQDETAQTQFTSAANQNMALTKLLHGTYVNGKPVGDGALYTAGPLGFISRSVNHMQGSNYDVLKQMVEAELGGGAGATYDHIMQSPFQQDQKERAIRALFEAKNPKGWQYYHDALGGRE